MSIFFLLLLFKYMGLSQSFLGQSQMSLTLLQSGFHRIIKYRTDLKLPEYYRCNICIEQTLPAGVYVDIDQLNDLQRFNKISYFTESQIDVEAITSNSKDFQIYLHGDAVYAQYFTDNNNAWIHRLPIHFRYHLPGNKSFEKVNIPNPNLYINCKLPEGIEYVENSTFRDFRCGANIYIRSWKLLHNCEFYKEDISALIPIGYEDFSGIVTCMTIMASWAACFYLILALKRKSKLINKKV